MAKSTLSLNDELYDYLLRVSLREPSDLRALRDETNQLVERAMQISPDQGQFMALLVRLIGARRILEVGTFTGYSALAMAQALPDDGELVACDVSPEWTAIAKRHWQAAGMSHKIKLHLAPALDTLSQLINDGANSRFDLAFIDADKENVQAYFEACQQLVRRNGLILIDNTLWGGSVIDESIQDSSTRAIRAFNAALHQDSRVQISLLPIGDGLTLARKR